MAGEGRTDRPNYKASSHRLRSPMRNDRQGRRIEIEGKEDCERGGDRPGRSWLRRQGAPSRHYPLTGNYPSSGRLVEGARARARVRCIFFFSFSPLSSFHSSFSSSSFFFFIQLPEKSRCGIAATIVQRAEGERKIRREEAPREQRNCDRGSNTENRSGMRFRAFPPPFI